MAARPLLRYAKADDCRAAGCLPRCLLEHRPPEASRVAASGRSTRLAAAPARPASSARSSAASTTSTRARENARLRDHAWCLAFPVHPPFAGLVERTPTAAIAGPLIIVGVRLLKPAHIETARRNGDFAAYLATALGVVLPNLLHGVGDPLALAIGLTGWRVIRAPGGMVHITGSLIRLDLARPVAAPVATAATSAPPTVMTCCRKAMPQVISPGPLIDVEQVAAEPPLCEFLHHPPIHRHTLLSGFHGQPRVQGRRGSDHEPAAGWAFGQGRRHIITRCTESPEV